MLGQLHIFVVMGYGCHLDTPLGNVYLPRVSREIFYREPDYVILCGGFTQRRSAPKVSEAECMRSGVRGYSDFIIEDDSYTSLENIRNAAMRIKRVYKNYKSWKLRITIFCEAQRAPSVIDLARHFMGDLVESIDDITVETASWERADPFKQVWKMIYNRLAMRFPYLARRERKRRIRRAEQL